MTLTGSWADPALFVLTLHGPIPPPPPLPSDARGLRGLVHADGSLALFWVAAGGTEGQEALYHSVYREGAWMVPEVIESGRRWGRDGTRSPVVDSTGAIHLGVTVAAEGVSRPKLVSLTASGLQSVALGTWGGYVAPALVGRDEVGALFVGGHGAGRGSARTGVAYARVSPSGPVEGPVAVSDVRPGIGEFEPVLLPSGKGLYAAWIRDADGNPLSWERLVVSHSGDGGRSWSRNRLVDSGGHIMRLHGVHLEGRPYLVYLRAGRFGGPFEVIIARLDRGWRRPTLVLGAEDVIELTVWESEGGGVVIAFVEAPSPRWPKGATHYALLDCDL